MNSANPSANPRLLVVTPTLGKSEFLDRSVELVRALALDAEHLLCCPRNMVAALQARFPHCRVVEDAGREGGIYGALNVALKSGVSDWGWFTYINDDDELAPGFGRMAATHLRRPSPEPVVYGDVRRIDDAGESLGFITTESDPAWLPAILHQGISPLNQQGMLFHRDVVEALDGFDLKYRLCADLDYWVRALAAGFAFRYYPLEVGRFRIRAGQLSGDISLTRKELSAIAERSLPDAAPKSVWQGRLVRWRYRLRNLPRYLQRMKSTGLASSEKVLQSGGPSTAPAAAADASTSRV